MLGKSKLKESEIMKGSKKFKSSVYLIGIIVLMLMNVSCAEKGKVSYPVSKNYGENLLTLDKDSLIPGQSYSLEVELSKKSELEIIITNLGTQDEPSVAVTKWKYDYNEGWTIGNYQNGSQSFRTTKRGITDMKIVFQGTHGSIRVDYYENSSEITNTKKFDW